MIGLAEEKAIERQIGRGQLPLARGHDDPDRRTAAPHRMGQFQPVRAAWHIHIRQQQGDVGAGSQDGDGFICIAGLDRREAGFLGDVDRYIRSSGSSSTTSPIGRGRLGAAAIDQGAETLGTDELPAQPRHA